MIHRFRQPPLHWRNCRVACVFVTRCRRLEVPAARGIKRIRLCIAESSHRGVQLAEPSSSIRQSLGVILPHSHILHVCRRWRSQRAPPAHAHELAATIVPRNRQARQRITAALHGFGCRHKLAQEQFSRVHHNTRHLHFSNHQRCLRHTVLHRISRRELPELPGCMRRELPVRPRCAQPRASAHACAGMRGVDDFTGCRAAAGAGQHHAGQDLVRFVASRAARRHATSQSLRCCDDPNANNTIKITDSQNTM